MADLIDRQVAIEALAKNMPSLTTPDGCGEFDHDIQVTDEAYVDCMQIIHELPSAQPKTGRWEKMEARGRVYRCNQCGNFLDFDGVNVGRGDANYCPNCGAKMEG